MITANNEVELLAPAGNWDALETVVAAGADAVYLGGKKHNMRLLRSGFNFSNEELKEAVKFTHNHGVKLYITVNNLQSDRELEQMSSYLKFLNDIKPDALIIQDLGVLELIKKLEIDIPLHSSVMVNVHNKEMAGFLEKQGIERFIVSRELSFSQVKQLSLETGCEYEYFIHGDMCFSQSGQCLLSGMVFGNSSNRGRCLKPCRWPYSLIKFEERGTNPVEVKTDGPYYLAVKDMCVYRVIPELIQSGIKSFKIEGRMKPPAQLKPIIAAYREAIDAYLDDPAGYKMNEETYRQLYSNRVRNHSTCFALKNPGPTGIGYSGEREPKFFSQAREEKEITGKEILVEKQSHPAADIKPKLSVKVINLEQLKKAVTSGADRIYLGGEVPSDQKPCGKKIVKKAVEMLADSGVELVIASPRITMPGEIDEYRSLLNNISDEPINAILAGNPGIIEVIKQETRFPIFTDFGLNTFNSRALKLLSRSGIEQSTIQLESSLNQAVEIVNGSELPVEIIAHGHLPFMISDHCLLAELLENCSPADQCTAPCKNGRFGLMNETGRIYPLITDQYCRNHLYLSKELALLPYLNQLTAIGFASLRIEAQLYKPEKIEKVVSIYRNAIDLIFDKIDQPLSEKNNTAKSLSLQNLWQELLNLNDSSYTLAAYEKGVLETGI